MDMDLNIKAINLWDDFANHVSFDSRYFPQHEVLEIVKATCGKQSITLDENEILYRARIFNDKKKRHINESDTFKGYDKKNSYVPTDNKIIKGGRANPSYVSYLYAADNKYTAMVEVRPYLRTLVSVAEIKVLEQLNIVDFSYVEMIIQNSSHFYDYVINMLMLDFQIPNNNDDMKYIPTQVISEYIKSLGYDGIKFKSSLDFNGCNYAIYYPEKCEAISSDLFQTSELHIKFKNEYNNECTISSTKLHDLELKKLKVKELREFIKNMKGRK